MRAIGRGSLHRLATTVGSLPKRALLAVVDVLWPRWRLVRLRWWLLGASGWLTMLGVQLLPPGSAPRVALVFGFVLICPGLAFSLLLPICEAAMRWVLAIALSISIAIVLNVALTMIHDGSVTLRLAALALITSVAVVVAACRPLRQVDRPSPPLRRKVEQ
jgi:uncharacterized membrane protein